MLHHLTRLFTPSHEIQHAYALYAHINAEARQPHFFEAWGVPDTLDGRFEMILLHMFAYLHTMKQEGTSTTEAQRRLIEAFFQDMDRSVRELGVGDTGVSRRIKAMANAFYGRINAFETSLGDNVAFEKALRVNTYGTVENDGVCRVQEMREYLQARLDALKGQPLTESHFLAQT